MRPAPSDPPEIEDILWENVGGAVAWYVGANTGQSLPQLRARFTNIIAFEPAEECWPYLEPEFDVRLVKVAVSDNVGVVALAAPPSKISTGQLVTPGTVGMEWDAEEPGTEYRQVPCATMDALAAKLPPPSFVLVDVEGHEGKVLDGARDVISKYRPGWLLEFHSPAMHTYCEKTFLNVGYDVFSIRHPHYAKDSHMWHQHGWLKAYPK